MRIYHHKFSTKIAEYLHFLFSQTKQTGFIEQNYNPQPEDEATSAYAPHNATTSAYDYQGKTQLY